MILIGEHLLFQIYKWLLKLKNENSKLVTVTSIGLTYERRETYLIKVEDYQPQTNDQIYEARYGT